MGDVGLTRLPGLAKVGSVAEVKGLGEALLIGLAQVLCPRE
jgi:hypothetical protein